MIFLALVLALAVALAFAAVSTRSMLPFTFVTWDRRLLSVNQVMNREILHQFVRRLSGQVIDWWHRASFHRTVDRFMKFMWYGLAAFFTGFMGAFALQGLYRVILWCFR